MLTDKDLEELRQERHDDYLAEARRERKQPAPISWRERALINALQAIVRETMAHPPVRPVSADSYLPPRYVAFAQEALALYGDSIIPVTSEAV